MDISKTYIKMTLALPDDMAKKLEGVGARWFYIPTPDRTIRLFEQDQLQEMIETGKKEGRPRTLELVERFNGYCATHTIGIFTSMEQLWLAFVMREKFNKVWDGEKWE